MVSEEEFDSYLEGMTDEQAHNTRAVRDLIRRNDPGLDEQIGQVGMMKGLLTFTGGTFLYAVGPKSSGKTTLHLFPIYVSKTLQERHGDALKKFMAGKSCLDFKRFEDLPLESIEDIVRLGSVEANKAMQEYEAKKLERKRKR